MAPVMLAQAANGLVLVSYPLDDGIWTRRANENSSRILATYKGSKGAGDVTRIRVVADHRASYGARYVAVARGVGRRQRQGGAHAASRRMIGRVLLAESRHRAPGRAPVDGMRLGRRHPRPEGGPRDGLRHARPGPRGPGRRGPLGRGQPGGPLRGGRPGGPGAAAGPRRGLGPGAGGLPVQRLRGERGGHLLCQPEAAARDPGPDTGGGADGRVSRRSSPSTRSN